MAVSATERYKILSNIVAQKGTDNVDLHAELAKAEGMIHIMDTQRMMSQNTANVPVTSSPNSPDRSQVASTTSQTQSPLISGDVSNTPPGM
jgi:hypothetical protein